VQTRQGPVAGFPPGRVGRGVFSSVNIRDDVKSAARRVRFLLPECCQKRQLEELLDAAPGTLNCDKTIGGRTRALLARLNAIQEALARPGYVHGGDIVPTQDSATTTLVLALVNALTVKVDGVTDPTRPARIF